jgi:SAM-dependent methyltransferase
MNFYRFKNKLACPVCKGSQLNFKSEEVLCLNCHNHYPIEISADEKIINFIPGFSSKYINPVQKLWQHVLSTSSEEQKRLISLYTSFKGFDDVFAQFEITGRDVLDVGGNSGTLRRYLRNKKYVCLEPDLRAYERRSIIGRVDPELNKPFIFIRGVGEYLPFKSTTFDSIIMWGMIEHLFDLNLAIAEAYRVLRFRGRFYVAADFHGLETRVSRVSSFNKLKNYYKNFGLSKTLKRIITKLVFFVRQKLNPWKNILDLSQAQVESGHLYDNLNHNDIEFLADYFGFKLKDKFDFEKATIYTFEK